jgi:hypothetical protein
MKVFEFHFNPRIKPDLIIDSFCYEPENIYEKKMGGLYMVGLLKYALPKNVRFVEQLAKIIKDKYYRSTIYKPEKSLKESLKAANDYLEGLTTKGDVSWLGNLSFSVLSLKDLKINFTKVGDIKILLIRGGKIIDIDEKVSLEEIEPYPLKIFNNTVSGKLTKNDMVMMMTKDIFEFFQKQKLLEEIANSSPFDKKSLKEILNGKRELLSDISGVFLMILMSREIVLGRKETIEPKDLKEFSFKEAFSPILVFLKNIKKPQIQPQKIKKEPTKPAPLKLSKAGFNFLKIIKKALPLKKLKKIIPSFNLKKPIDILISKIRAFFFNKKLALVLSLIILLFLGYTFSNSEKEKKIEIYTKEMEEIKEDLSKVDSFLILKETNPEAVQKANILLQENWDKISSLSKKSADFPEALNDQVLNLKNQIAENLSSLNKLEKIEEPELVFEFDKKTFVPHRMLGSDKDLYFFSPYMKNILMLNENRKTNIITTEENIALSTRLNNSLLFFEKPLKVSILENGKDELGKSSTLETPYPDFELSDLFSFKDNLYFLDKEAGQIIKYPYISNFEWGSPTLWLSVKTTKIKGADSLTIDGSIWVLNQNSIYEYYATELQNQINIDIYPKPKEFSKILTYPIFSYLYVLEPVQKRIVILSKNGELIKQFQSEEFDNLLDFSVSDAEDAIYLLNGMKVFKIEL